MIALYDGGVLSPAVLERVLGAFFGAQVNWHVRSTVRAVDGHSMQEIVAMTMMPGRSSRTAQKDYAAIIEHIESIARPSDQSDKEVEEDDEHLLDQLSSASRTGKRSRTASNAREPVAPAGFNPFFNAKPPKN